MQTKYMYLPLLIFLLVSSSAISVFAQKSPRITVETDLVKISFGQPSKRERKIFGELVPYGKVWRTGANEATEVMFTRDVLIAGKPLKAGTYTLYTIPQEKEWTIIFNSTLGQWGAYDYEKIKGNNVLEFQVPVQTLTSEIEKLDINYKDDKIYIAWDRTKVAFPVVTK